MRFRRVWANASPDTFDIFPINELVKRYLSESNVSIDPFARNKRWATYTNDLNPETLAEYHMEAFCFLQLMQKQGVSVDLVLFDPPYSRRQVKEVYNGIGRHYGVEDSQEFSCNWRKERRLVDELLVAGGHVISFGWNSVGMGKWRGYRIVEILLVCHGGAHNDTICTVEKKLNKQKRLL